MTAIFTVAASLGMNNAGSTQWWVWANPSAVIAALPSIGYYDEPWQYAFRGSLYVHSVGGETADNPRWANFTSTFSRRNVSDYNAHLGAWPLADDFFETFDAATDTILRDVGTYEYDAVVAMGLLACAVAPTGPLPADFGTLVWENRTALSFEGLTGRIEFDGAGNREARTANMYVGNFNGTVGGDELCDEAWTDRVVSRLSGGAWEWTGGDLEASGLVFGNNGQTRVADCLRDLAGSVCYEPPEEDGGGGGAELGLLGLLGLLGVLVVYLQVLRRRQQSIAHERFRLVRTEQVPVLPKLRGSGSAAMAAPGEVGVGGYHLFLSHIWASGQDQVGVIKARLSHFLVGARIFRDVDDMEDISLLEDYVDASSLVLVFLSEGYFLSRNCLREAHAAVRGGKPMVLVHETDVKHGGAPLETLYAECPDDLRDAIFGHRLDGGGECGTGGGSSLMRQDSMSSSEKASRYHRSERASADAGGGGCASSAGGGGAPLIRWHRLNDLQVTSLLQVASVLLRVVSNSPTADSALYLPSHVTRKSVDVAHAVRLFVSEHNPGAERVAGLLCSAANGALRKKTKGSNKRPAPPQASAATASMSMSMSTSAPATSTEAPSPLQLGAEATSMRSERRWSISSLPVTPSRWQKARSDKRANFASVVTTAAAVGEKPLSLSPWGRKGSTDSDRRKSTDGESGSGSGGGGGGGGASPQQQMLEEMARRIRFADLDTCGDLSNATHMLLYLNKHTWQGDAPIGGLSGGASPGPGGSRLSTPVAAGASPGASPGTDVDRRCDVDEPEIAATVRRARAAGVPIVMVHEQEEACGGCPFERFVYQTPYDLIAGGLYNELAVALHPSPEETAVALVQVFQKLASTAKDGAPGGRRTNQLAHSSRDAAKKITCHLSGRSSSRYTDMPSRKMGRMSKRMSSAELIIPMGEMSEKRKSRAF